MIALADGRVIRRVETVSTRTVLGIRFWDGATDAQIRAGLRVRLWPALSPELKVDGRRTASDIYAFHRIPGMRSIEWPLPGHGSDLGSPPVRDYVAEVRDLEDRFVPVALGLTLPRPERGLFLNERPSAGGLPSPGFYLFPAATRATAPNMAVIRGDITHGPDGPPAAHAVVSVAIPAEPPAMSVADAGGRFAIHVPFPVLPGGLSPLDASPLASPLPPVADRDWPLTLTVLSEPGALASLPGTDLPDLRSVLLQSQAFVVTSAGSPSFLDTAWTGTLSYGGEVVVTTAGLSSLAIEVAGSPP